MKKAPSNFNYTPDRDDVLGGVLDGAARFALIGGLIVLVGGVALCLVYFQMFAGSNPPGSPEQAMSTIRMISTLMIVGGVCAVVGSTYTWWGEETLGIIQLAISALLYFSPLLIPSVLGGGQAIGPVGALALQTVQTTGAVMSAISIAVLVWDIMTRVKQRAAEGARAEQLKFGKGLKEEKDIKNVFMGKCWQLPFCRKFIRERCPIYHSKRTCWKERVGCMCEEEVIRNALENRPIPKDAVAAGSMIPRNFKISNQAKAERCRQCVIYNEHQKHKYKLCLYGLMIFWIAFYVGLRAPLLAMTQGIMNNIDNVVKNITFNQSNVNKAVQGSPLPFNEIFLVCLIVVMMAYSLKALEYVIFKLKL